MLRRVFATMVLRSGINASYLRALMGHSSLAMRRMYIMMVDEELVAGHKPHGPVGRFLG
jgi:site-specific recombinase XerD